MRAPVSQNRAQRMTRCGAPYKLLDDVDVNIIIRLTAKIKTTLGRRSTFNLAASGFPRPPAGPAPGTGPAVTAVDAKASASARRMIMPSLLQFFLCVPWRAASRARRSSQWPHRHWPRLPPTRLNVSTLQGMMRPHSSHVRTDAFCAHVHAASRDPNGCFPVLLLWLRGLILN